MQVLNQDGLANVQIRLLIIKDLGAHEAAKAAKEDILLMLRPEARPEAPPNHEDEEEDPRH